MSEALAEALREIARQKKTDELETEHDVECADFEGGYDACIDTARAALAAYDAAPGPAVREDGLTGIWPDFIAPSKYEAPDPRWQDPGLPDFQLIWKLAREKGYAVGLHGSMKRDCDLIAAPWIEGAAPVADLIAHLREGLNADEIEVKNADAKPHGRQAFVLQIRDAYKKAIDISVMAPAPSDDSRIDEAVLKEKMRMMEWCAKRQKITRLNWERAARKALAGDMSELRTRIDLIDAGPLDVVLSGEREQP